MIWAVRNFWNELGTEGRICRAYSSAVGEDGAVAGLHPRAFYTDEGLSKAVAKVFVDYYNDGLIYQGERIINWDPAAKTALSNIEVIHKETEGAMSTFNYKVVETGDCFQVATTRPETMFGDVLRRCASG